MLHANNPLWLSQHLYQDANRLNRTGAKLRIWTGGLENFNQELQMLGIHSFRSISISPRTSTFNLDSIKKTIASRTKCYIWARYDWHSHEECWVLHQKVVFTSTSKSKQALIILFGLFVWHGQSQTILYFESYRWLDFFCKHEPL